jgi:hypothetical protein
MHESILIEEPQASVARHSKASVHLAVEVAVHFTAEHAEF